MLLDIIKNNFKKLPSDHLDDYALGSKRSFTYHLSFFRNWSQGNSAYTVNKQII